MEQDTNWSLPCPLCGEEQYPGHECGRDVDDDELVVVE